MTDHRQPSQAEELAVTAEELEAIETKMCRLVGTMKQSGNPLVMELLTSVALNRELLSQQGVGGGRSDRSH